MTYDWYGRHDEQGRLFSKEAKKKDCVKPYVESVLYLLRWESGHDK